MRACSFADFALAAPPAFPAAGLMATHRSRPLKAPGAVELCSHERRKVAVAKRSALAGEATNERPEGLEVGWPTAAPVGARTCRPTGASRPQPE